LYDLFLIKTRPCILQEGLPVGKGAPKGGGVPGCSPAPKPKFKKNTDFADIVSKVLRDLPFSRKHSLKSADDQYIRILKNKLIKLKKTRR
jgi:hypothetical protein